MFAGQKHLDNLCVMIDRNNGQLDLANRMILPMPDLEAVFRSFNWEVHSVDSTQYNGLYAALEQFRFGPRNGKPTVIICHATKGHGALSDFLNKHKVTVPDRLLEQEMALQGEQRRDRVQEFSRSTRGSAIIRTAGCCRKRSWSSPAGCVSTCSAVPRTHCR
jgi:transketolase